MLSRNLKKNYKSVIYGGCFGGGGCENKGGGGEEMKVWGGGWGWIWIWVWIWVGDKGCGWEGGWWCGAGWRVVGVLCGISIGISIGITITTRKETMSRYREYSS